MQILSKQLTQVLARTIRSESFQRSIPITRERVIERGNQILKKKGERFIIADHQEEAVERLIKWYNPSLQFPIKQKNFMLLGNTGSGKSLLLKIFNDLSNDWQHSTIIETQSVALLFAKSGWSGDEVHNIIHKHWNQDFPNNYSFEDIGREEDSMHVVGNIPRSKMTNTFIQIFHQRHLLWENKGIHTHGTTNLDKTELLSRYDQRTFSRMMGSTEFIPCGIKSSDRDFRINPEISNEQEI
jgi:DNA replication protein DnaC